MNEVNVVLKALIRPSIDDFHEALPASRRLLVVLVGLFLLKVHEVVKSEVRSFVLGAVWVQLLSL